MASLKKYDLKGKAAGEISVDEGLLTKECNSQMVKDYLVAIAANKRQWSASTQTRSEVSHSKRKPFAQKGSGNARQGFLGAPQFRGGGRVHAPKPKFDQHIRINRKERRLAIRKLLTEHILSARACVLDYSLLKTPQTKTLFKFLKSLQLEGKRVLFLGSGDSSDYTTLSKSLHNIPRVEFNYIEHVGGRDLVLCQKLVILESAVEQLKEMLGS